MQYFVCVLHVIDHELAISDYGPLVGMMTGHVSSYIIMVHIYGNRYSM